MAPLMEDVVPMLVSLVLGTLLGWERQADQKPAGLRTHTLVCLGSTLFVLTARHAVLAASSATFDASRIIHGIVTGIGFLGAGTILRHEGMVLGITTAATIWVVAAVGAAVGVRAYALAGVSTALALIVLRLYRKVDAWLSR
ncbi:MAG: MgtC/SapB family protein [Candidatus Eisenbacteria bacterium]|uniref:MgtC/SapB family protein n=1 Tax=Eiseniibacteriota bacterium TaxID=2212470 RepID=A0A538U1I7_UNCEI|nr:MAG: MgtC/SapB family protein [Candidatus Eisenbacteria bacterium]